MTRPTPEHLHDELVPRLGKAWCECGDGPFTPATWDDHRMEVLGHLPVTLREEQLLDELDRPGTKPYRRDDIARELAAGHYRE